MWPIALALIMTWSAVDTDCLGQPKPGLVRYVVPFAVGEMAPRTGDDLTTPWPDVCELDVNGALQECATWTLSEWDVGQATQFDPPDPPAGQVYMFRDPIAIDAVGLRSDQCSEVTP